MLGAVVFNKVSRRDHTGKAMFVQRSQGREGLHLEGTGRNDPGIDLRAGGEREG